MKKKDNKPAGIVIFVAVLALLLLATHCEDLNRLPGINVKAGEVSVEIGDFRYSNYN